MSLTGPQLTQLITHPHKCKVWTSVFKPSTVFTADVLTGFNNEHNVIQIPYENGVGTPSDVKDGMTLYVYDSLGRLRGIIRTKWADATYIYVAENDEVTFDDGQSLVILDTIPPWTKFPTCDISGDNPIFYKDYNVPYTDQNDYPPPVPILGPALRCLVLDLASSHTWKAGSSYSPRTTGTISTYAWTFEGGSPPTGGTAEVSVEYSTAGLYKTTLTITDDQSKTAVAHRWIRVIDSIEDADLVDCTVQLAGSFAEGGWRATIKGMTDLDLTDVPDQSLVAVSVLALDGNDDEFEFGGFDGCHQIYFCGYLNRDTVERRPDTGWTTFEAETIDRVMSQMFNFDVFVVDTTSTPSNWLEVNSLDIRKAGNHLLRWHSNVMEIADVHLPTDSTRTAGIDMPQANLFTQLRNMCQTVRMMQVGSSRYGSLHIERDVQHLTASQRQAIGKLTDLFRMHYQSEGVSWPRAHRRAFAMLELAGVQWDGSDPMPLFSRSPGAVPVHEGDVKEINGLAVADQDDVNTLCGMAYAEEINKNIDISMPMSGNWMPALDVFPQPMLKLPSDFVIRGVNLSSSWVVVRGISFSVENMGAPNVVWMIDRLNDDHYGRSFFYPKADDLPIPPYEPPPPPPPPPMPGPPGTTTKHVIIASHLWGMWTTSNFEDESPIWGSLNGGLSGLNLHINWFARDPVNYKTQGYLITEEAIFRNDGLKSGGTWQYKATNQQLKDLAYALTGGPEVTAAMPEKMKPQVCLPGAVYVILNWTQEDRGIYNNAVIYTLDRGENWLPRPRLAIPCGTLLYRDWSGTNCAHDDGDTFAERYQRWNLVASPHTPYKIHLSYHFRSPTSIAQPALYTWPDIRKWWPSSQGSWYMTLWPIGDPPVGLHVPFKDNKYEKMIYVPRGAYTPSTSLYRYDSGFSPYMSSCDAPGSPVNITPSFGNTPGRQGMLSTYTWNKNYVWFASEVSGEIGVSLDAGDNWTQMGTCSSMPPGCASGFPYNNQLFILGRQHYYQQTNGPHIMASYDAGKTWHDKTGDLVDKIKTFSGLPNPNISVGCIAPEW